MTDNIQHPDITRMELYGVPEPDLKEPTCPCCGKECDWFYYDMDGEIFGCDLCIQKKDAWDVVNEDE